MKPTGPVLVLNAGSSSLKFAVYAAGREPVLQMRGQVSGIGTRPQFEVHGETASPLPASTDLESGRAAIMALLKDRAFDLGAFSAVGHRIVHGGQRFVAPTRVDETVLDALDALRQLAPLHLPFGLSVLRKTYEAAREVPQIACFDTAFHATQGEIEFRLPLPRAYHERGYRRYGFHGLNYEHVVRELPRMTGRPLPAKLLAAHLGNGASMCAIAEGRSVATTMGFSTADGLVMGTRTGSLDPGVLIALIRDEGYGADQLEDLLYRKSGLLGLSGLSADMRVLLASDQPEARFAVDYYCYSAARHAASLAATMGGAEAIAFSGGVGENSDRVRQRIMAHLSFLGIASEQVFVVPANEEAMIARHTLRAVN